MKKPNQRKLIQQPTRRLLATAPILEEVGTDRLPGKRSEPNPIVTESGLLDAVVQLEAETWPSGTRASREDFQTRLRKFPAGFIYCLDTQTGTLCGLTTSMLVQVSSPEALGTWDEMTSNGSLKRHDPRGNAMYIVSAGVSPHAQGSGVGSQLIQAQLTLARSFPVDFVALSSRLPSLSKSAESAESYIQKTQAGYSIDPNVRFLQRCGFQIHSVKANSMPNDPDSQNYGVLMIFRVRY